MPLFSLVELFSYLFESFFYNSVNTSGNFLCEELVYPNTTLCFESVTLYSSRPSGVHHYTLVTRTSTHLVPSSHDRGRVRDQDHSRVRESVVVHGPAGTSGLVLLGLSKSSGYDEPGLELGSDASYKSQRDVGTVRDGGRTSGYWTVGVLIYFCRGVG